jgi:hypothetical protein
MSEVGQFSDDGDRNIAAGLIRLNDTKAIKRTTERIARNPLRTLPIIATPRYQDHLS